LAPRLPSFDSSAVGSFDYDVVHDDWTWSPELLARCGPDASATVPTTESFFAGVHPDDRDALRDTLDMAASQGTPFACRYRFVRPGRPLASVLMVGDAAKDDDGAVTGLHGYAIDLTDLLETEASAAVEQSARHRASIEQVKGALMHTYGIDQDEAFDVLRSYSNTLNLRLATLAELVARAMSTSASDPNGARVQGRTLLDLLASAGGSDGHPAEPVVRRTDGAPQAGFDRQAARE
jgi:hypothetical protein